MQLYPAANTLNMLMITNDGRKLALDQRLINPMLPDDSESKVAACASNAFEIWEKTADRKSAQLIFCDLSTPKNEAVDLAPPDGDGPEKKKHEMER